MAFKGHDAYLFDVEITIYGDPVLIRMAKFIGEHSGQPLPFKPFGGESRLRKKLAALS